MHFLMGWASGWSLPTAVATMSGGGWSGQQWKYDGIVLVPFVGFSFLL